VYGSHWRYLAESLLVRAYWPRCVARNQNYASFFCLMTFLCMEILSSKAKRFILTICLHICTFSLQIIIDVLLLGHLYCWCSLVISCISGEGEEIYSICLSVHPFVSTLYFEWTDFWTWVFCVMTLSRLVLQVRVKGQEAAHLMWIIKPLSLITAV